MIIILAFHFRYHERTREIFSLSLQKQIPLSLTANRIKCHCVIMASNFNYIERPANNSNYCRFCNRPYKEYRDKNNKIKHESRANLFNQKGDKPSLKQRLSAVNILIEDDPNLSPSICDKCENKIKKLEEAENIKNGWSGVKRKRESQDQNDGAPSKKSKIESPEDNLKVCKVSENFFYGFPINIFIKSNMNL